MLGIAPALIFFAAAFPFCFMNVDYVKFKLMAFKQAYGSSDMVPAFYRPIFNGLFQFKNPIRGPARVGPSQNCFLLPCLGYVPILKCSQQI